MNLTDFSGESGEGGFVDEYLTIIIIVAVVFIFISCSVGLFLCFTRCLVVDRKRALKVFPLVYLPEKIINVEKIVERRRKITKRERRRVRIRRHNRSAENDNVDAVENENGNEEDRGGEDDVSFWASFGLSMKSFGRVFSPSVKDRGDEEVSIMELGNSSKSFSQSTKSKRFISQDRLTRAENRKLLTQKSKNNIVVEELKKVDAGEEEGIVTLFDLEGLRQERVESILDRRKEERASKKKESKASGEVDVVALNSGPPESVIPAGYKASETVPVISDEALIYQRVMFLFENGPRATGWFIGTIVGPSRMSGCNYNIKYDRAETGTQFVDGIRNVYLALEGDAAYGRRWIIIKQKNPGGTRKLQTASR